MPKKQATAAVVRGNTIRGETLEVIRNLSGANNMAIAERQQSSPTSRTTVIATAATDMPGYLNWGAVFGGTAVTLALASVLTSFGAAIGLAYYPGLRVPASFEGTAIIAALLLALVQLWAFGMGGYLTGRMRPVAGDATRSEIGARDGMNGLVMWAMTVILLGVLVAVTSAFAIDLQTGAQAASQAGAAAPSTGQNAASLTTQAARRAGAFAGLWTSVLLLLCGLAAWWAAGLGGQHRDEGRYA